MTANQTYVLEQIIDKGRKLKQVKYKMTSRIQFMDNDEVVNIRTIQALRKLGYFIDIDRGEDACVVKEIDVDRAENKPSGTGCHYSLDCSYYTKSFSNVNDLINDIISSGMDPNYEITWNGVPTTEMAIDFIVE